jgi:GAF domain-containing protein
MRSLPQSLEESFSQENPELVFAALLPALGEILQVDRCFLLLRNPQTRIYRIFCWRQTPEIPDTSTDGWEREQEWEKDDPMFAAALRTEASIFVEDIETASPTILNREFERKYLGHRALVHAHLCQDTHLWGILQPSVFKRPRAWSDSDRELIERVIKKLTPIVIRYIKTQSISAS